MSETFNLLTVVQKSMSDIVALYGLSVVEVSSSEVLLRAGSYTLDVYADRDGVSMVYFDKTSKPCLGYNVLLYLINKRRSALTFSGVEPQSNSHADFIENGLKAIAQHLRNAGDDILSGSRDWIRGYSWPKVLASERIAGLL